MNLFMPNWVGWFCLIILCGSGLASDVPFVFDEDASLAGYSSFQLKEASSSSSDLVGVPSVISPSDNEVLEIPVTGGGGTSEGKLEKNAGDLKDELNRKVEHDNDSIHKDAVIQASKYPGDHRIDQICQIFYYLKYGEYPLKGGWRYVPDARGIDSWNYANQSFAVGKENNCVGIGDCDDFAILMSAYVESIGGATRIILANNNTTGGHAYTEVYLGKLGNPNDRVEDIIMWLQQESGSDKIYGHIDTDKKEIWLNLDWGPDKNGNAHPGGPLFQGYKHYVLRIRDDNKMVPLRMPEAFNRPPRLISLTPDKSSPQDVGSVVTWTTKAADPDNDQILYRYLVEGYQVANWRNNNSWVWTSTEADIGDSQIEVQIRDGKHAGPNRFDSNGVVNFSITESTSFKQDLPQADNTSSLCRVIDGMEDYSNWNPFGDRYNPRVSEDNKTSDKAIKIDYDLEKQGNSIGIYKDISPGELDETTAINILYDTSKDIKIIKVKLEDMDKSTQFVKSFGEESMINDSGIFNIKYNETKCISTKRGWSSKVFSTRSINRITIEVTRNGGATKGWLRIREIQVCE